MTVKNQTFRQCLASVPDEEKKRFEESFRVAEHLAAALKEKNLSPVAFAKMIGKRKCVIDSWLTGRHAFKLRTVSQIETVLKCRLR